MFNLFRKQQRPAVPPRIVARRTIPEGIGHIPKFPATVPQESQEAPSVSGNLFSTTLDGRQFVWMGTNRAEFYRYLRDHVPIISAAIWSWVHLCATPQNYSLAGPENEKRKALDAIEALDARVLENPLIRREGIKQLTEQFFLELFTVGSFAGEIVPLADGSGIDYFHTIDTDRIQWERDGRWKAYVLDENDNRVYLSPERFFFASFGADIQNPRGVEPLASIPFVAQIQEAMLADMARSSRVSGTPRLQIKISPPRPFQYEQEREYQARINNYFDDTVAQFRNLEADDNVFTWDDVEVSVIGGDQHRSSVWRLNREQVIEDVITGLRLYPWVLGRSHGTTKNWVEAQFNLLMQIVDSVQNLGASLGNWLRNTELKMKGIRATSEHLFEPNQDPFILARMQARKVEFETIDRKVQRGYISKEDGARELGYSKAFKERVPPDEPLG